ncbi:uncharacterized protein LOC126976227 [Leptidea sinapis]|uniref:uncharacterized protein LOC126976227 n=1 Tax=Leptidea sinapis TaxID=189913 RepID=UPI0021C43CB9|nr:uncharacterized protein LOC126976227 [Leptidea sinapis]
MPKECKIIANNICLDIEKMNLFNCRYADLEIYFYKLCDGVVDCPDHSDEIQCQEQDVALSKFEAHKIFNEINKSLNLKAAKDYKMIKETIIVLLNVIENIQRLITKSNPSPEKIKRYRRQYFSSLSDMYTKLINHSSFPYESEAIYSYLITLNQQMVSVLKYTSTGNKKILSNSCFCKQGICPVPGCSAKCQKICSAQSNFTQYHCTASDKFIHIHQICDGKHDCPGKDDELNCKKDVCRSHHLNLLRNKIQEVGTKQKGTAVGELLSTWKMKVIPAIKIGENEGRPTHKRIKDIVNSINNDLLATYGSVQDYRRSGSNYALSDFLSISHTIVDTIRSCTY